MAEIQMEEYDSRVEEYATATNKDIVKTLTPEQIHKLLNDARCLACYIQTPCETTEFHAQCITGYQAWLERDADVNNWAEIKNIIG